jgi:hypothetical protein
MVEPGLQVPPDLAVQLTPAQPGDSDYAHRTTSNLPPIFSDIPPPLLEIKMKL